MRRVWSPANARWFQAGRQEWRWIGWGDLDHDDAVLAPAGLVVLPELPVGPRPLYHEPWAVTIAEAAQLAQLAVLPDDGACVVFDHPDDLALRTGVPGWMARSGLVGRLVALTGLPADTPARVEP